MGMKRNTLEERGENIQGLQKGTVVQLEKQVTVLTLI
jgi:hypothetical protein